MVRHRLFRLAAAQHRFVLFFGGYAVAFLAPFRGGWVWMTENPTLDAIYPGENRPALGRAVPLVCGRQVHPTMAAAREDAKAFVRDTTISVVPGS